MVIKPQFIFEDFERSMSPPLLKHFIRRWKPEKRFFASLSIDSVRLDRHNFYVVADATIKVDGPLVAGS